MSVEVKKDIYWVGAIDWEIRNFHGYNTRRGTTYNAYLIVDEKITLVDTVKEPFTKDMISAIREIVDPTKIDYIVANHVEMDHSGALPEIMPLVPNATIITTPQGEKGLRGHYEGDWNYRQVKSGDEISLGKKTLKFIQTPMIHWPDNMLTYIPKDKLLLSNDSFGQHIATAERFDTELGWEILREETAKYYANIVFPYGKQVKKAIAALGDIEIDMIAPSHGIIWKSFIKELMDEYKNWSSDITKNEAVIIYNSMWGSTTKMAHALKEGLNSGRIKVTMRSLKTNHISDLMTDILDNRVVLIGSPTLNNSILPTTGGFLAYLKGLRPHNRLGLAFGSYGWSGESVGELDKFMKDMKWETPIEPLKIQYVPTQDDLLKVKEAALELAKKMREN